jgi:REP element-mobilizing transposase RayT
MVIEEPFALFITWTCYGTWLPGDPRGHVSNTLRFSDSALPKQNMPETDYSPGDKFTNNLARKFQKYPVVYLSQDQARTVVRSLVETADKRNWRILRGAIMYNHIHVVVTECPDDGPGVRRILKGNSQTQLSKIRGKPKRWWTAGGSNRYLHTEEAIRATIRYIAEQKRKLAEIVDMEIMP